MSVLKNLRSLSSMEFYKNAIELRKAITMWMVRDFGTRRNARSVASVIKDIDEQRGEITRECIVEHYKSWRGTTKKYAKSYTIKNMDELFTSLFGTGE